MSSQAVPQLYILAFLGIIMLPVYGCTQHKSLLTSLKSEKLIQTHQHLYLLCSKVGFLNQLTCKKCHWQP